MNQYSLFFPFCWQSAEQFIENRHVSLGALGFEVVLGTCIFRKNSS